MGYILTLGLEAAAEGGSCATTNVMRQKGRWLFSKHRFVSCMCKVREDWRCEEKVRPAPVIL